MKEFIEKLREKADVFEKSGCAVDGIVKDYRKSADMIEELYEKSDISGFVEKLIERLSNTCDECIGWNHHKVNAYSNAIRIVKQLAEEFATDINVGSKAEQIADDLSKVLKEAKDMGCKEIRAFHHIPFENVEIVINALRAYNQDSTKKNQGWVPCSERLPKTNGVYQITRELKVGEDIYRISGSAYFDGQDTWHNDNRVNHGREYLKDIVAWKPLQEPYNPEEKKRKPETNFYTERFNRVI